MPKQKETKALAIAKAKITKATNAATSLSVKSDKDLEKAATLRAQIKEVKQWATDQKKPVLDRLNELLKIEKGRWKPLEDDLENALTIINQKMISYQTAKDTAAKKEETKIAEKVASGEIKKEETVARHLAAIDVAPTRVGKTQFRKIPDIRITNESKVPREYMVPDMVKIRQAAITEGKKIPGVEVYDRTITAG